MVNKQIEELVVTDAITDPGGTVHTGTISGGGGSGTAWDHSGTVTAQSDVILYLTEIADTESLSVASYTAVRTDATPLPTNSSIVIATLDGSGNSATVDVIKAFDGSTLFVEETSDASYTNSSGVTQLVAILFVNDTNSEVDLFSSGGISIT